MDSTDSYYNNEDDTTSEYDSPTNPSTDDLVDSDNVSIMFHSSDEETVSPMLMMDKLLVTEHLFYFSNPPNMIENVASELNMCARS